MFILFLWALTLSITEINRLHPINTILNLSCTGSYWTKDGTPIATSAEFTILITSASQCGVFDCVNEDSSIITSINLTCFNFVTYMDPQILFQKKEGTTKYFSINQTKIKMECKSDVATHKIVWTKNQNQIIPDERISLLEDSSILEIYPAKFRDHGEYICQVIGQGTYNHTFNLTSGVFSLSPAKEKTMILGDFYTFVCKIRGYPIPKITWNKEGVEIFTNSSKIKIATTLDKEDTLVVGPLVSEDEGKYACMGYNGIGGSLYMEQKLKIVDRLEGLHVFLGIVGVLFCCSVLIVMGNYRYWNGDRVTRGYGEVVMNGN